MNRTYLICKVKGLITDSDNGKRTSCVETVIYTPDQDPLRLAMLRNPELAACHRYKISTPETAFNIHIREEANTMQPNEETMKSYGYKNLTNKWNDPEYRW